MDSHGVTLVVGIPASGKTTFGRQHADFVIDLRVFAGTLTDTTPLPLLETAFGWNEEHENGMYMVDQKEENKEREQKKVSVVFLDNLDVLGGEKFQLYMRAGLRRWRRTHFIVACREGYFADEREIIYYTAPVLDGHTRREELFHVRRVSYNGVMTGDIESALCAEVLRLGDESLQEEIKPTVELLKKLALCDIERSPGVLALMQEVHGGKYDGVCDEGIDAILCATTDEKVDIDDDHAPPAAPLAPVDTWAMPLFASASAGVKKLIKAVLVPVKACGYQNGPVGYHNGPVGYHNGPVGYRFAYASQRARLAAECIYDYPSKYLDKIWLRGMRTLLRELQKLVTYFSHEYEASLFEIVRDTAPEVNKASQIAGANAMTILAGVKHAHFIGREYKRGIKIRGADLSGSALLRYANMREADLRDCDLRATCLDGTDLRGADMRGVRWGQARSIRGRAWGVNRIVASVNGKWLYVGSSDVIEVWNVERLGTSNQNALCGPTGPSPYTCARIMRGHTSNVEALVLSADDKWLYSGSHDYTIRVWRVGTAPSGNHSSGHCVRIMTGHTHVVKCLALTADGKWLFSGSFDDTIRMWSVGDSEFPATYQCVCVMKGHGGYVYDLVLSVDEKWLYSGATDATIRVWSIIGLRIDRPDHQPSGQCVHIIRHKYPVYVLALSPDNRWLFSGSGDGIIRVWSMSPSDLPDHLGATVSEGSTKPENYMCVRTLEGHTRGVDSLVLSADGKWLYSGSWDKIIRVWSVDPLGSAPSVHPATGQCTRTMVGHIPSVEALCLSADGKWLYSGSWNDTIRVWDVSCPVSMSGTGSELSARKVRVDEHTLFSGDGLKVLKEAASK